MTHNSNCRCVALPWEKKMCISIFYSFVYVINKELFLLQLAIQGTGRKGPVSIGSLGLINTLDNLFSI